MGENAFLGFLALLTLAVIISSGVFYRYVYLIEDGETGLGLGERSFRSDTFETIVEEWDARTVRYEQATGSGYINIFLEPVEEPKPTKETDEDESLVSEG